MEDRIFITDLVESLKSSKEQLGIGLHGIFNGSLNEKRETAQKIFESGLTIQHGWKSILSTVVSLGNKETQTISNDIANYRYGNGEQCNVIIVSPMYLRNSAGEKIFVGFPPRSIKTAAGQYTSQCIFDQICSKLGKIPSEFIYGYYDEKSMEITRNPNYYLGMPIEKQDELFEKMQNAMTEFTKGISEAVINGDKKRLEDMQQAMQKRGWKEPILDNAIEALSVNKGPIEQQNEMELEKEGEEHLKKRITDCMKTVPVRRSLWGKSIDTTKLQASKEILKAEYKKFNIGDVHYISNDNVESCIKALQLMKKIPLEFQPDKLLEEDLKERLVSRKKKVRTIITEDYKEEQKSIEAEFDMCIASYLITGGSDIYRRFHNLINSMNQAGINANVGKSIVRFGQSIATRMEAFQNTSQRNTKAWNFLLEPILHAYTVSKNIDNERWNPAEHKAFEDKLVNLGLIELPKEQERMEPTKLVKSNARAIGSEPPAEKGNRKQPIMLEQEVLRQAICQYINTGMMPIGFKISDDGKVRRETQIEEMERKAKMKANINQEEQKQREAQKKKEASRLRMQER